MATGVFNARQMPAWATFEQRIIKKSGTMSEGITLWPANAALPPGFDNWYQHSPSTCTAIAMFLGDALLWDGGVPSSVDMGYIYRQMLYGIEQREAFFSSPEIPAENKQFDLLHPGQLEAAFKNRKPGYQNTPRWLSQKEVQGVNLLPGEKFPENPHLWVYKPETADEAEASDKNGNRLRRMTFADALRYLDKLSLDQQRPLFATISTGGTHIFGIAVFYVTDLLSYYYAYDSAPGRFLMTVSIADLVFHISSPTSQWLPAVRTSQVIVSGEAADPKIGGAFDMIIFGLYGGNEARDSIVLTLRTEKQIAGESTSPAVPQTPAAMDLDQPAAKPAPAAAKKERSSSSRPRSSSSKSTSKAAPAEPPAPSGP